jgi:hypothetical protein
MYEAGQALTFAATTDNDALFAALPAVSSDGTLNYTPADDANGSVSVSVILNDDGGTANGGVDASGSQTFTITINAVNDAPSFTPGSDVTVDEDCGAQTVSGWASDISAGPANESGQGFSFAAVTDNDALFAALPAVSSDGTLSYTPADDANGSATVSVRLSDQGGTANGGSDSTPVETFTITVNAVNDAPSFTGGDEITVNEDCDAHTVDGWATGISSGPANESGQAVSFSVTTDNDALFSPLPAIDQTGTLTFRPAANANGSATVSVALSDDGGTANGGADLSAIRTFLITVDPVNDAPSVTAGADVAVEEDRGAQSVNGWAGEIFAGHSNEGVQNLTFTTTTDNDALFAALPSIDASGTLTFESAVDACGSADVSVVLADDGGTESGGVDVSPPQTFTITVACINDAPVLSAIDDMIAEAGATLTVHLVASDVDPGDVITYSLVESPAGMSVDAASGVITWTPANEHAGVQTVVARAEDNSGAGVSQTFEVEVLPTTAVRNISPENGQMGRQKYGVLRLAVAPNPVGGSEGTVHLFLTRPRRGEYMLRIFNSVGDLVHTAGGTFPHRTSSTFPFTSWDLVGRSGRTVRPGTYLATLTFREDNGTVCRLKAKIGVSSR